MFRRRTLAPLSDSRSAHPSSGRSRSTRRRFLSLGAATGLAGLLPSSIALSPPRAFGQPNPDQKFLFVIGASGGASIIDSFLPVAEGMVVDREAARRRVVYPDQLISQPAGSNLRCVNRVPVSGPFHSEFPTQDLLARHYRDMCVVTVENTSVNHVIAQKRAVTGAGIDGGRTLMEAMAERWGDGLLLPNCNMSNGGYAELGDRDVPLRARGELIADPALFSLATHGSAGIANAPLPSALRQVRDVRSQLEHASPFAAAHGSSPLRTRMLGLQQEVTRLEDAGLIRRLLLIGDAEGIPTAELGLAQSSEDAAQLQRIREVFPGIGEDSLQAQAALGFLLARHGVACAISLGPSFAPNFLDDGSIPDTPIAFDYSHTAHIPAQNIMWSRLAMVIDGLVTLLSETPHGEGSMWDRSLIYVATDFGRSKDRPTDSQTFGSGHHLNNGNLFLSPMLKGNRVYGGVDPETGLTFGVDENGTPAPGSVLREGHLYSLVAQAMDIDFAGRIDMSALLQ
ncbi:MAG: hypothetical protein AAGF12_01475 [Myxococcota bacterium]